MTKYLSEVIDYLDAVMTYVYILIKMPAFSYSLFIPGSKGDNSSYLVLYVEETVVREFITKVKKIAHIFVNQTKQQKLGACLGMGRRHGG